MVGIASIIDLILYAITVNKFTVSRVGTVLFIAAKIANTTVTSSPRRSPIQLDLRCGLYASREWQDPWMAWAIRGWSG